MLSADVDAAASSVSLRWNMVNYSSNTAYILLKSTDGVVWEPAAANPVFRNYNSSNILAYHDHFSEPQKYFYQVKIYNTDHETVALSNIATAEISKKTNPVVQPNTLLRNNEVTNYSGIKKWLIYPNPVTDMLNLFYKKNNALRGVIKVMIQDETGKVVVQFRQASNNKQLHIPVSNLHTGLYFIKIDVLDEEQMNEKFVKQ